MKTTVLYWIFCCACLLTWPLSLKAQVNISNPGFSDDQPNVPGRLIIKFKPSNSTKNARVDVSSFINKHAALKKVGVRKNQKLFPHHAPVKLRNKSGRLDLAKKQIDLSLIYEIEIDPSTNLQQAIALFKKQAEIEYAEPVYTYKPLASYLPNDPQAHPSAAQYYLSNIKAYEAWAIEKGNASVTIGIVDYGFSLSHNELSGSVQLNQADSIDGIDNDEDGYIDNYAGWDIGDHDRGVSASTGNGRHGTWVSGIAAGAADNNSGMAGVGFKCKFLPIKAEASNGRFFGYEGLVYAADHGCKVINLSWGRRGSPSQYEQDIIDYAAITRDAVVVVSAGNDNNEGIFFPASYNNVISVAGTNALDQKWSSYTPLVGSNYNDKIDICAPSEYIYTSSNESVDAYNYRSGTSFASPQVAAAAALIRSKYPALTAQEVTKRLLATADNIDEKNPLYIGKLGRGRLNMAKALAEVSSLQSVNVQSYRFANKQNQSVLFSGDTASMIVYLENEYGDFKNLQGLVTTNTPGITIIQPAVSFGALAPNGKVNNENKPFRIKIDGNVAQNSLVSFKLVLSDGVYTDTEFFNATVNPAYLTISNKHVAMTITSQGRFGYDDDLSGWDLSGWVEKGLGFTYKGTNLLVDGGLMIGTSPTNVSSNVIDKAKYSFWYEGSYVGGAFYKDSHFASAQNLQTFHSAQKDVEFRGVFTDTVKSRNPDPVGVKVEHRNYTWQDDKFIVVEYQITNVSGAPIANLYTGIMANWDINGYYTDNIAKWDSTLKLGYMYNKKYNNMYAGLQLLTMQQEHYYAIDNVTGVQLFDYIFSEAEKFTSLSSDTSHAQSAAGAFEVLQVLSAKVKNLQAGETRTVAFAFLAGDNLAELQASAALAKAKFTKLKTSPAPVLANLEVCRDDNGILKPLNGSKFNLYNSLPLSSPVAQGNTFNLGTITQDSTYYITSVDSLYESEPVAVQVKAITHDTQFDISQDTIGLYEQEILQVTDKSAQAVKWTWSFGDNTASNEQNPSHAYNSPGKYTVKLVTENKLGCQDSLIKEIVVVNGKNSLSPQITDQQICEGEKLILAPANGTHFNLYTQLPLTSAVSSGKTFDLGFATKDTTIYITCTDFLYESAPVSVHIRVSKHTTQFEIKDDTLDLHKQEVLELADKSSEAMQWLWNFGDGKTSNEQHLAHTYLLPGEYTVTLHTQNQLGCKDSLSQKVVVRQITGTNEPISQLFKMYPNPTQGNFTVSITEAFTVQGWQIEVLNLLGQKIIDKYTQDRETTINLSDCPKSHYLVKVTIGDQVVVKKIVLR